MTTAVIFDLDDTLCDYAAARRRAKRRIDVLLAEYGLDDTEAFWTTFDQVDPPLFDRFTAGLTGLREYRLRRFMIPAGSGFEESGPAVFPDRAVLLELATRADTVYRESANTDIEFFDDALPALTALRAAGCELALLTNGPSDGQRTKIAALGLAPHLDHVLISEELGAAKPDPQAFAAALAALGTPAHRAVMVGDSPATDIAGARAAGIRAVLLDRTGRHGAPDAERISSLAQLPALLTGRQA